MDSATSPELWQNSLVLLELREGAPTPPGVWESFLELKLDFTGRVKVWEGVKGAATYSLKARGSVMCSGNGKQLALVLVGRDGAGPVGGNQLMCASVPC